MDQPAPPSQQQLPPHAHPRPARSKSGCLTCRKRKVRCDELRPRCSHCTRLNLQCKWRPPYSTPTQWRFVVGEPDVLRASSAGSASGRPSAQQQQHQQHQAQPQQQLPQPPQRLPVRSPADDATNISDEPWLQNPGAVDQLFDYASFMWEPTGESFPYDNPEPSHQNAASMNRTIDLWPGVNGRGIASNPRSPAGAQSSSLSLIPQQGTIANGSNQLATLTERPAHTEDHDLINFFIGTIVPPILAEVESERRWSSMRQMLISMSNNSTMVRSAILAFSSLMFQRQENPWGRSPQHYYETALAEVASLDPSSIVSDSRRRQVYLASLFFLCYVDILEDRMNNAHDHLKRAYGIFQQVEKQKFGAVEIRLLSWIRLLDARAVSAGGEGLFLSSNSELLIVHPSPAIASETETVAEGVTEEVKEWDVEDSLFQVLYSPGVIFFQKVQSYMGRISMIDPWHRSRGTVEDEVEVMRIAAQIMKDLRTLYDERPTLMDLAIKGDLKPPHISASLAIPITRAFRTYLSNYYASKVHLHRVAFKHLPLSKETAEAMEKIRILTRLLVDTLEPDAALPVSQLWPLLMLGSEEEDLSERAWIKEQILRMAKVATNASITAHVLDEVQNRQDASKTRADIRSVMHDIFDSCFAIM
ncbi:unnamed protein product [Clonostachys chloroleuca]|uniref:Zn(2)-C6 fungal-type domain-containing protein n=1 Tax=Clonostachys chloroleuca TaxID=1926264 RepID=A0AA35Q2Q1_9HYPO|nr:unnamed protein product [Clonostachys chloroleuca]